MSTYCQQLLTVLVMYTKIYPKLINCFVLIGIAYFIAEKILAKGIAIKDCIKT